MKRLAKKLPNVKYQDEDADVIDYDLFDQFGLKLRGPAWRAEENAEINFIGSARVFGRLVEKPFTKILTEKHRIVARNLGFSGCVPAAVHQNKDLMNYINASDATPVFQVCAGDGARCDWFEPAGFRRVTLLVEGAEATSPEWLKYFLRPRYNRKLYADLHDMTIRQVDRRLRQKMELPLTLPLGTRAKAGYIFDALSHRYGPNARIRQIRKCQNWIFSQYKRLIANVRTPPVLLYFNSKNLDPIDPKNISDIVNKYPQFVDLDLFDRLKSLFSDHIIVVSEEGMPWYRPGDESNGKLIDFYPSKEMHAICADHIAEWYRSRRS